MRPIHIGDMKEHLTEKRIAEEMSDKPAPKFITKTRFGEYTELFDIRFPFMASHVIWLTRSDAEQLLRELTKALHER